MPGPTGFSWRRRKSGEVAISHHGREVTIVRGKQADRLVARLDETDDEGRQHLLARATGNYKRGNERR